MPVTIRPLIEFEVVHQDGQVGNIAALHVADHRGEDLFVGHAQAHHEEVGVGMLHEQEGVGDDLGESPADRYCGFIQLQSKRIEFFGLNGRRFSIWE